MQNNTNESQRDISEEEKLAFLQEAARSNLVNFAELVKKGYQAEFFHELIGILLQEAAEKVKRKEKVRIILSVPPRHGKTELASTIFPAWALGKYPEMKFILSSYGADLSETIGMKTRDLINSEAYQFVFPGITLRPDVKAKAKWMTNKDGSFTGVGMGTAVTGTGADCFPAGTLISTDKGIMTIENLYQSWYDVKVKGFNHKTNETSYYNIEATRRIKSKKLMRLVTSGGRSIEATREHRFYTLERGYTPLEKIKSGDHVVIDKYTNNLQKMWSHLSEKGIRNTESVQEWIKGYILQQNLRTGRSRNKESAQVFDLSESSIEKDKNVLREKGMSKIFKKVKDNILSLLSKRIPTNESCKCFLFDAVQKRLSLNGNEGETKSEFQARTCPGCLSERVLQNEKDNIRERQQRMCCMSESDKVSDSSYKSEPDGQHSTEPSNDVSFVSFDSSRIEIDTVSMVEPICDREVDVYDIQVEDVHNFFANEILVHNCIIIDDPHKDRAEAESETVRESVWEYYRSTLYSRLEGYGAVIIIMQRWHTDDLVGKVKEESEKLKAAGGAYDEWEIINFPAVAEEDEYFRGQLIRKQGEALWPSKFPLDVLENIKQTSGIYNWVSQYMQDPIATEAQEFKEFYFKYFEEQELTHKRLRYYTLVDPAISQKTNADNTVVVTIAKEVDGPNIYRVREDAGHFTPEQTLQLIFAHQADYRSEVAIEVVQYQMALKYSVIEEQRKRQLYFTVHEIRSSTNKESRIRGLLPLYSAGVIYHRKGDVEYERELLSFPRGKRDDRIDAMSQWLLLNINTSGGTVKQYKPKWASYGRKK